MQSRQRAAVRARGGSDNVLLVVVLLNLVDLEVPDPAAELFATLGVDRDSVRERLSTFKQLADEV
jgi:hypothetical protein